MCPGSLSGASSFCPDRLMGCHAVETPRSRCVRGGIRREDSGPKRSAAAGLARTLRWNVTQRPNSRLLSSKGYILAQETGKDGVEGHQALLNWGLNSVVKPPFLQSPIFFSLCELPSLFSAPDRVTRSGVWGGGDRRGCRQASLNHPSGGLGKRDCCMQVQGESSGWLVRPHAHLWDCPVCRPGWVSRVLRLSVSQKHTEWVMWEEQAYNRRERCHQRGSPRDTEPSQ